MYLRAILVLVVAVLGTGCQFLRDTDRSLGGPDRGTDPYRFQE